MTDNNIPTNYNTDTPPDVWGYVEISVSADTPTGTPEEPWRYRADCPSGIPEEPWMLRVDTPSGMPEEPW